MVDICICSGKHFSELKAIIDNIKLSYYDGKSGFTKFGVGCKYCIPYVKLIFRTGLTSFNLLKSDYYFFL